MTTYGLSVPTCNDESAFISNHQVLSNITNIHYWDNSAGAWSANLRGAVTPFAFLPPTPLQAGDLVVFGIDSTLFCASPFSSLVFDIATAIGVGGGITITWRYSDAGADPTAWAALTVQDNTNADGLMTGDAFDTTGIKSVHWEQPSDWVNTIDPTIAAANIGVTAYWVCAHVSAAAGAPTPPTQTNRDIYSVQWPYIEIDEDDIGGDIEALAEVIIRNQSQSDIATVTPALGFNTAIVGLRSLSRGEDFTPFINFSDNNQITISSASGFLTTLSSESGRGASIPNPAAAWTGVVRIEFTDLQAVQYYGKYRLFLRGYQVSGAAGTIKIRAKISIARNLTTTYGLSFTTDEFIFTTNDHEIIDMGIITLPPTEQLNISDEPNSLTIEYEVYGNGASDLVLYGAVLMPTDEWSGTFNSTGYTNREEVAQRKESFGGLVLDIDSINYPKYRIRAPIKLYSDDDVTNFYQSIVNNPLSFQASANQRLYFLFVKRSASFNESKPEIANSIHAFMLQRYFSLRGDN